MFRWIFGKSKEQPFVMPEHVKPRKPQWEPDGQGGYRKIGIPTVTTTAATLTLLADASQLKPSVVTTVSNTPSLNDADSSFPDDARPIPNYENVDALEGYLEELAMLGSGFQRSLQAWKEKKIKIIGDDESLKEKLKININYPESNVEQGVLRVIREFFENIFRSLKEDIEPANMELHELLDNVAPEVEVLCHHLEEECSKLQDNSRTQEAQRLTCIGICDTSIEINEALIKMVNHIRAELIYCLHAEQVAEQVAKQLILTSLMILTKIPFPDLSFTFNAAYRSFLYNEITKEKIEIDKFETNVRGELREAMQKIVTEENKWLESKKKAELTTLSIPRVDSPLLYAKNNLPIVTAPLTDEKNLSAKLSS
ncbi:MAG: hypothetical protein KIT56_04745 [Gammaproteobacteria bacterium]|nr:hypothetical protein [Gammaproteobacteria bacterium]MCW5583185.1 hypothetical protein [Gammaproteobacteria bacterium]